MGKYLFGTSENSKHWLNKSCTGLIICVVIHSIFISGNITVQFFVFPLLIQTFWKRIALCFIWNSLCFLAEWSHFRCMLTDPGTVPSDAVPLSNATEEEKMSMCVKCGHFKPPRAHHCSECKRCIVKMDHHCPWINNCVGVANVKYFLLFLIYTFLFCFLALIIGGFFLFRRFTIASDEDVLIPLVGFYMFCAFFFCIFTMSMLADTVSSISSNITAIDTLKGIHFKGEEQNGKRDAFGGKGEFQWDWLIPTKPVYIDRDEVMETNEWVMKMDE